MNLKNGVHCFILDRDGRTPIPVQFLKWAVWFDGKDRLVAFDIIRPKPPVEVSTVFIGLDYNVCRKGPPMLWETMVFGGAHDGWGRRYSSHDAALAGHAEAVTMAHADLKTP